jgi:hypothetical protein
MYVVLVRLFEHWMRRRACKCFCFICSYSRAGGGGGTVTTIQLTSVIGGSLFLVRNDSS